MKRGYFGVAVVNMKVEANYGTLFRSALAFDADLLCLIGRRFRKQPTDTTRSERHIPLLEFDTAEDFLAHVPYDCKIISVECIEKAQPLHVCTHPERAIYVLGPEDGNVPPAILAASHVTVRIPTLQCLNVAVAGSIVMYDRMVKEAKT